MRKYKYAIACVGLNLLLLACLLGIVWLLTGCAVCQDVTGTIEAKQYTPSSSSIVPMYLPGPNGSIHIQYVPRYSREEFEVQVNGQWFQVTQADYDTMQVGDPFVRTCL